MMNILYVMPRFPSPSETFIAEEMMGVRARGNDVTVVSLARPPAEQVARMGSRLRAAAENVIYLDRVPLTLDAIAACFRPSVRRLNGGISSAATFRTSTAVRLLRASAVKRIAHRVGTELIFAHWPRATEVAMVAGEIARLPVAFSVHAHEVAHDNGHFTLAFEHAQAATFCNAASMDYLMNVLPTTASAKSSLVYHGIDLSQFKALPLPPAGNVLKVVTAGRLTPTKGIDRLIRAATLARDRGVPFELMIIGDGSERGSLETLVTASDLGTLVRFTGWVPHEQMVHHLSAAHVFALMADADFNDGLPNVVLEAMAIGRPIIISPLPAVAEAVLHNENGYVLSTVEAVEEFADCCTNLRSARGTLERWAAAAIVDVRARHDRALHLDRLCALLDSASKAYAA
ncbi:glycosyltransferase family 4 protein [Emcibacter sp. SYSU 3D8]|uniref:glycosyltransferase family 4 protein n=1 Tax=Emcibacter sp. SYSU 3D8 TaxID=3133969 RepID=UPI0031FEC014